MRDAAGVVVDRLADRVRIKPVPEAAEYPTQLLRREQEQRHQCVGLLCDLITPYGVAFRFQNEVEPSEVAVTGAVGLQVELLEPLVAVELREDLADERDV